MDSGSHDRGSAQASAPDPPGVPRPPAPQLGGEPTRRVSLPSKQVLLERMLSLREGSIIVVTLLTAIYFALTTSTFLTSSSFKTLLPFFAPFAILGAGEVFVMILGEIDLSIGATYLFAPLLYYKLAVAGIPYVPSVLIALAGCMVIGFVNGFFTAIVGISSFVTTLGMLFTIEGLTLIVSHGVPVELPGAKVTSTTVSVHHVINGAHIVLTETVNHVSTFAKVLGAGTYSELFWALAIVIVGQIVLTFTRWGLYTVAVGSNKLAASEAGVRVRLVIDPQLHPLRRRRRLRGNPRGRAGLIAAAGRRRRQRNPVQGDLGGGDRRHAARRRVGDRRGRADRRPVPGRTQRRADPQGRQRRLPALLPGPGDHPGDDRQRVRAARAQGFPQWLTSP